MFKERGQDFFPEMDIKRESIPCWYELSLGPNKDVKYIYLKIHKDFVEKEKSLNTFLIMKLQEKFSLPEFATSLTGDTGFGGIFNNLGLDENKMFVYRAEIPKIGTESKKTCSVCHGRHKSSCDLCYNTGKEISFDRQKAYQLSASFTVITDNLTFPKNKTSSKIPQLLKLNTKTDHGEYGGGLWGKISLNLNKFLERLNSPDIDKICTPAMIRAYQRMFYKSPFLERRFNAGKTGYGTLFLNCIGDRSGISSDIHTQTQNNEGYDFSCHNVDNLEQQISLIAGLAALHDAARKEM